MTINLTRSIVSNKAGPRSIGWFNDTSTVVLNVELPTAEGGTCILKQGIRQGEVGNAPNFLGRIVRCSAKLAVNDVAFLIGRELEYKNVTTERSGDSVRLGKANGCKREEKR